MKQVKTTLIGALIATFGLFIVGAFAQSADQTEFNLEAVTCWEIITLPEENEIPLLMLLYGYDAGKEGKSTMSGALIESDLENLVDYCEENPDTPAVQAINTAQ